MPLLVGLPDLGRLDFWIKARDRALWRSGETYENRGFVQELSDSGHILIWLGDDQVSSHTALTGSHKREASRAVTNVCARELTEEAGSKAARATIMLVAAETLQGQRGPRLLGEVVLSGAYSDQTRPEWEAALTALGNYAASRCMGMPAVGLHNAWDLTDMW